MLLVLQMINQAAERVDADSITLRSDLAGKLAIAVLSSCLLRNCMW